MSGGGSASCAPPSAGRGTSARPVRRSSPVHEDEVIADLPGELHLVGHDQHGHAALRVTHDEEYFADELGSSADVTSSNSMTCGSIIRARAMATRCCWPPES